MNRRYHTSTYRWKSHSKRSSYRLRLMQSLKHHALGAGGLTNIIPSSIAKLIPFSSHRTPPANTPPLLPPHNRWRHLSLRSWTDPKPPARSNYRKHFLDDNRIHFFDETSPQRERSTRNTRSNLRVHFASHPPAADSTPRPQVAQPGESQKSKERLEQELRAKIEAEYKAKALEESEKLTAALKKKVDEVDKRDKRIERERKKIAQHLDEIIPGSKRKRMPSPEVIPNPVGGGFGMDLDYFYISDSKIATKKTKHLLRKPQTKKARTSSPEAELIGGLTANNATPTRRHQTHRQHELPHPKPSCLECQQVTTQRLCEDVRP